MKSGCKYMRSFCNLSWSSHALGNRLFPFKLLLLSNLSPMNCILILGMNLLLPFPACTLSCNCLVLRERSTQHHHRQSPELPRVCTAAASPRASLHRYSGPPGGKRPSSFQGCCPTQQLLRDEHPSPTMLGVNLHPDPVVYTIYCK